MAERVQLKRTKGWRMPDNTRKVDRSTAFGNPFVPDSRTDAARSVTMFRCWLNGDAWIRRDFPDLEPRRQEVLRLLPRLRGKNLACWCGANAPCHADVLLEFANRTAE